MKKLSLLGSAGMFGRDAEPVLISNGFSVTGGDLPEVDICDEGSLGRFLDETEPDAVVNAAAYTNVDGAESHREEAFRINAEGAGKVAEVCRDRNIFLVHISTDYVFPGTKKEGYLPSDPPAPAVNAYGESKLEGERAIIRTMRPGSYLICRTQWLYGGHGKNFVDTIVDLASSRDTLRVVDDQWGVPTHTASLAFQIGRLLTDGASGVAHTVGGGGPVTWFTFAREIVRLSGASAEVLPCTTEEFPRAARRPVYGWLRNDSVPAAGVTDWKEDLAGYLSSLTER